MKVIKDAYMAWLDKEIEIAETVHGGIHYSEERVNVLKECRTKLTEVITEEFHKLSEKKENEDA